jgi:hypothetical protein
MEECEDNRLNFKLIHPFTLCVIGPTQAGKSRLVLEIIDRASEIISETIDKIIYVYTEDQPLFHQFKRNHPEVIFTTDMEDAQGVGGEENTLIVFDDKLIEFMGKENNEISTWFIRGAHHRNASVIVLLQNAFGKNMRTVALNSMYSIYLNNPRDKSTIVNLGKQCFPGKPRYLTESYEDAISKPYGYIFIDFHQQTCNMFRVRNSIYPTHDCKVYVPKPE